MERDPDIREAVVETRWQFLEARDDFGRRVTPSCARDEVLAFGREDMALDVSREIVAQLELFLRQPLAAGKRIVSRHDEGRRILLDAAVVGARVGRLVGEKRRDLTFLLVVETRIVFVALPVHTGSLPGHGRRLVVYCGLTWGNPLPAHGQCAVDEGPSGSHSLVDADRGVDAVSRGGAVARLAECEPPPVQDLRLLDRALVTREGIDGEREMCVCLRVIAFGGGKHARGPVDPPAPAFPVFAV